MTIIHGLEDDFVPVEVSDALAKKLFSTRMKKILIEGAGHALDSLVTEYS